MTCLRNTSSPLLLPPTQAFFLTSHHFFLGRKSWKFLPRATGGGERSARETIKVQAYSFVLLPHTVAHNFFRKSLYIIEFRHFKIVFPSLHRLHRLGHSSRVRRRHRLWRRIRRWSCRLTGFGNSRRRRFVFGIATPKKDNQNLSKSRLECCLVSNALPSPCHHFRGCPHGCLLPGPPPCLEPLQPG